MTILAYPPCSCEVFLLSLLPVTVLDVLYLLSDAHHVKEVDLGEAG